MGRLILTLFIVQFVNFSLAKSPFGMRAALQRSKRADMVGAPSDADDKYDPEYRALAEASLQAYKYQTGSTKSYKLTSIDRVTIQVVQGHVIRIDLNAISDITDKGMQILHCHSKIWEESQDNIQILGVKCHDVEGLIGGANESDPDEPGQNYRGLAEKALQKYIQQTGNYGYVLTRLEKVTGQAVFPPKNSIIFTAINLNLNVIHCYADIFHTSPEVTIDVHCEKSKSKRYN